MFITILYVLCFGVAIFFLAHAIRAMIKHFGETELSHPLFIVFLAGVGGIVVYGLVAKWAMDNVGPRERLASFISLMVCSIVIWMVFHVMFFISKAAKWGDFSSGLALFLSTIVPLGAVFYLNVSRAIFALN